MKKIALLLAVFAFSFANAQAPLEEGGIQLNAGVGTSGWGTPVYVGLDFGIAKNWTLGGELSYQSYNQTYASTRIKSSILGVQANGNYHFNEVLNIPSEWDFYAGANLNYYSWNTKSNGNSFNYDDEDNFGLGLQVGGRYFFSDNFGLNLQVGGGNVVSGAKIGITYKF
ncbi:outer membrane beta-barrel protein [Flavobacterium weaverense]|uniref:Outer membrane protein with beta-barrel domain n=1 Tax=Flavobacterium weaverense TaxID=271156 RepID=A0A3M0A3Q7_9FLAO|nr:outer membrane beta-barrel protein [Flavobacterium weaverense]RMA77348.1 outer membrane protein with beta-barrel domain [Flavobacterium weaverense]